MLQADVTVLMRLRFEAGAFTGRVRFFGRHVSKAKRQYDGLLNFFKPCGMTSAQALYRVRSLTGVFKSGHAGTLDPAADGVLLMCMGQATRRVERLMDLTKTYRATARLDVTSRSLDADSPLEAVQVRAPPTRDQVQAAAAEFIGLMQQVPPAVSALKIRGVRAYKLDSVPPMRPRAVRIERLTVSRFEWPELDFEVVCGRGTYIRAIIRDLGRKLGSGGCLTRLTRTAVGPFTIDQAATFADLENEQFDDRVCPLEQLDDMLEGHRDPNCEA